jgi:hypothetical protein
VLDLDYAEDSDCDTDMNVVMNDGGGFIELQGTAEGHSAFRREGCELETAAAGARDASMRSMARPACIRRATRACMATAKRTSTSCWATCRASPTTRARRASSACSRWCGMPNDPMPLVAEGVWEGHILHARTGSNGFGYDPVFFSPAHGCGAAELPSETKNRDSHRGIALAMLRERLGRP